MSMFRRKKTDPQLGKSDSNKALAAINRDRTTTSPNMALPPHMQGETFAGQFTTTGSAPPLGGTQQLDANGTWNSDGFNTAAALPGHLRGGGGGGGGGERYNTDGEIRMPGEKKKSKRFGFLRFGKKKDKDTKKLEALKSLSQGTLSPRTGDTSDLRAMAEEARRLQAKDPNYDDESAWDNTEPTCVEELPPKLQEKLSRSGLSRDEIDQNWYLILAILQFVGKTRFKNPWKEHKKELHGPTGRDYRGETADLFITDQNPAKLFKGMELIGQGGFGSVYLMTRRADGVKVAVKKMPHSNSKEVRENSWEVGLLKDCQHENVVTLYGAYVWQGEMFMVMEYLEGGSLADAVSAIGDFKEPHVAYAAKECLSALAYIHSRNMTHRDLKSANFVFTVDAKIKIIDFGLGRDISRAKGCTMLGSPFWMPPEMVNYDAHGTEADIWSFAISMIEMLNGHPPNYDSSVKALYQTGTRGINVSEFKFTDGCTAFLQLCLAYKPEDRPTAAQLMEHKWLETACDREAMQKLLREIFVSENLNLKNYH